MPTLLAKLITYHLVLLGGLVDFDSDSATFEEVVTIYRSTTTSDAPKEDHDRKDAN